MIEKNMDNLFEVACSIYDSHNFIRIRNKFEEDVQESLFKDLGQYKGIREIKTQTGRFIDLGYYLSTSESSKLYSTLVEIKIVEKYRKTGIGHIFPYVFGTTVSEKCNSFKNSKHGGTYIEDIEEGQIFKDIVKILEDKENRPAFFSENCNNYVLFYVLTDNENDAHDPGKLTSRLYDLFQRFDETSKKNGKYSVKITSGAGAGARARVEVATSSFTPLFYKTFFRYLGVKNVKCKGSNFSANFKHISTVLVKFQEANEFGFSLQVR